MTTRKPSPCRWTALAASLAAACAASSAIAGARAVTSANGASAPGPLSVVESGDLAPIPAGAERLYLEVTINQAATGLIAGFILRDGRLFAPARTLRDLGLDWPGGQDANALVALDTLPGVSSVEYDKASQRVSLTVPVELLDADARLGYRPPPPPVLDPATRAPGLLLNYDAYAQGNEDYRSFSVWNELRLFGVGPGVWRNSSVLRTLDADGGRDESDAVRLETTWQLDFPEPMMSVEIGDAVTGSLDWTRSTRFGGVRVSRNFGLQPYRLTVPLASFAGEAALPSTVDLYIEGIRRSQQQVGPGQFRIDTAPVLSGAGQAQMVITDINGQSRTVGFALYNARQLLQADLTDWSFEAGAVRRDYGLRSFSYADDGMASATVRHGASNALTLEAHAETTRDLAMGGVGATWLLGRRGGIASASYASSRHDADSGDQYAVGYQWQGRRFNAQLSTLRRDRAFRDVASLESSVLPLRNDLAFVGFNMGRGQLAASYLRQDLPELGRSRYASLSWSHSFNGDGRRGGAYLSVTFSRDLDGDDGDSGYLYLSLPLGERHQAWASVRSHERGDTATVGASRLVAGDRDDWGWRVQASAGDQAGGQAEVTDLTRYGQWRVGAWYWHDGGGTATAYADLSGGLLLMQGRLFPMRRAYDAFALVSTDGIADVPVKLENRFIGNTDKDGLLLVTSLNAWQANDLSIDPLGLPADVSVQRVRASAVPATDSGMLVRFAMRPVLALQFSLRGANGEWVPAGSTVRFEPVAPGGAPVEATVGYDGLVYVENPPAGARISVRIDATHACSAILPGQLPERGRLNLGELTCR